ncbi:HD domain-containing protein [Candidatus Peregrinibacteria bacterium]|nr:HD domain-containing protein [Candidatus Peregrinibacteria bacterium]
MQWNEFRAHIRHLSTSDQHRVEKAFRMGEKAHSGQKRKSGEPYFTHPIAVADMLADMGADADTIIAALLHDTIEDTSLAMESVEREFGETVTALIDGVTKLSRTDIGERPTLDEQTETLRKIFTLMQEDIRIMVIKLIDRLHNMQTVEFLAPDKQRSLAQETQDIYVKIADRLCMQDLRDDLQELCLRVLEPDLFIHLSKLRTDSERQGQKIVKKIEKELSSEDAFTDVTITYDEQSWNAYRKKFEVEGVVATGIAAISIAFVCPDRDTCYRVMGALHERWRRETLSFQDFINSPQINGYQGLHTTVILADGSRVRCKIRTHDMQRYADNGIATICFGTSAKGIMEELPWARRIAALSEDTKDRSKEFWESLQSDILGESIVIHGPSDESVHLPAGSTALDGAFFLFHETALRTAAIRVNGHEVLFQTVLKHGDSLSVTLSKEPAVLREWLSWTTTGLATAIIRATLAESLPTESITTGKAMLQKFLDEQKKGFLEEFEEATLIHRLQPLGFSSLEEAYKAIAQGRATAAEIYGALFRSSTGKQNPQLTTIHYFIPMSDVPVMDAINAIHRSYGTKLHDVRYRRGMDGELASVRVRAQLSANEVEYMTESLKTAGAMSIHVQIGHRTVQIISIICMFLFWGLDPVFAKFILNHGVDPLGFTVTRSFSIFVFAILLLIWTRQSRLLARISLSHASLWLAGVSLFMVNLFTYIALAAGSPVLYNTMLRGNAFILVAPILLNRKQFGPLLSSAVLTLAGLVLLAIAPERMGGFLFSLCVLLSFSTYTVTSRYFQSSAHVMARYSQFFFFTSAVNVAGALLLMFLHPVVFPSVNLLLLISAYCICFIGIPYVLFYTLTRDIGYPAISPWINVSLAITILGQALLLGTENFAFYLPAACLLILGSLVASRSGQRQNVL